MWFMGRADDVIKVAGNRLGTAEVESALVSHLSVAEAAVIGKPHKTVGETIKAVIILKEGVAASPTSIGKNRGPLGSGYRGLFAQDAIRQDHASCAQGQGAWTGPRRHLDDRRVSISHLMQRW